MLDDLPSWSAVPSNALIVASLAQEGSRSASLPAIRAWRDGIPKKVTGAQDTKRKVTREPLWAVLFSCDLLTRENKSIMSFEAMVFARLLQNYTVLGIALVE